MRVKALSAAALLLSAIAVPLRAQEPRPARLRASAVAASEGIALSFAWRYAPGDAPGIATVRDLLERLSSAGPGAGGTSGGVRICVNCAGVGAAGRIVQKTGAAPLEGYQWAININLMGTINVLRLAAEAMVGNEPDHLLEVCGAKDGVTGPA